MVTTFINKTSGFTTVSTGNTLEYCWDSTWQEVGNCPGKGLKLPIPFAAMAGIGVGVLFIIIAAYVVIRRRKSRKARNQVVRRRSAPNVFVGTGKLDEIDERKAVHPDRKIKRIPSAAQVTKPQPSNKLAAIQSIYESTHDQTRDQEGEGDHTPPGRDSHSSSGGSRDSKNSNGIKPGLQRSGSTANVVDARAAASNGFFLSSGTGGIFISTPASSMKLERQSSAFSVTGVGSGGNTSGGGTGGVYAGPRRLPRQASKMSLHGETSFTAASMSNTTGTTAVASPRFERQMSNLSNPGGVTRQGSSASLREGNATATKPSGRLSAIQSIYEKTRGPDEGEDA